jgi:hypothetical protein
MMPSMKSMKGSALYYILCNIRHIHIKIKGFTTHFLSYMQWCWGGGSDLPLQNVSIQKWRQQT